jgi:hypothetical protein
LSGAVLSELSGITLSRIDAAGCDDLLGLPALEAGPVERFVVVAPVDAAKVDHALKGKSPNSDLFDTYLRSFELIWREESYDITTTKPSAS